MKISRMNLSKTDSKIVAFFDFKTDDEIGINGFKLVNGSNGLFIAAPSQKGSDDKYYDNVILPKELKDELQKLAIAEYEKMKK